LTDGWREGFEKRFHRERAIKANFQQPDFFTVCVEMVHGFVGDFCAGPHHDDYAFGVGSANIFEQLVAAPDDLGEFIHHGLHFGGGGVVVGVGGLANLEEDIGILGGAAQHGMIGGERALAMLDDAVHVDQGAHVVFIQHFNLIDFVRGAETVEEVQEGNSGFERGGMGDQGKIHGFLNGIRAEHSPSGGAAEHDVGVVAEDGEGVRCDGARGHVEGRRSKFAGDLVHVGDHQEQSLGSGEGSGKRSGLQGSVNGSSGAAFALHFDDVRHAAEGVRNAFGRPLVRPLAHRRRWRDGIDGDHFADS
jgi:hypothetical protein